MTLPIPAIINDYFTAANQHDTEGVVNCFSADAEVRDVGKVIQGRAAIRQWEAASSKEYNAVIAPLAARVEGDQQIVTCRVSGDFPNSPAELTFAFVLADSGIATLEITV